MPATAASAADATRKRRCVKSGLVARLRRTLMLSPVNHPSHKTFEVPVGKWLGVIGNDAFRKRGVQEGAHFAVKFVFEGADKFGKPRAEACNTNFLNPLLPSVLIISRDRVDFFQKHLGSN